MRKIISANEVLTPEEFNHYMAVLEVDFPKVYQAYLNNIKTLTIINEFLDSMNCVETDAKVKQ